ncbi:MAG: tRNA (adenosine(37)-N6)-threonylcarbamoyltransferase complex transferase subunit TsaD [Candidatus Gracilibacteria bacterium]|nr:tRNA (adenosine(37)-N6)-threonylcarbamoyltransferase complex transferase subunit TsaD [Candidatus Gracilibacteria bacterium]
MKILAFETSCDDTSLALFEDDNLVFMDTMSQIAIHNETCGVVPEVAAREHANNIFKVLENVLIGGKIKLEEIDYLAVTMTPGLIPSLLTGITVAKTISIILNIPLIEINHIEAHIFANFLERKDENIEFPLVCLTVSGGHNEVYYMKDKWNTEKIGSTQDDSAGEAFDKVAKMMNLGYPGGPIIGELAGKYTNISKTLFPRVWLKKQEFDFSFSGLKSAVKREVEKRGDLTELDKIEISFEFQNALVEVLAYKLINAAKQKDVKTIMLAGGVSANDNLKENILKMLKKEKLNFIFPVKKLYSTDNAAMVGINAYYKIKEKRSF